MTNTQTINHQDNLAERFEAAADLAAMTAHELDHLTGVCGAARRVDEQLARLDSVMQADGGLDRLLTVKTD